MGVGVLGCGQPPQVRASVFLALGMGMLSSAGNPRASLLSLPVQHDRGLGRQYPTPSPRPLTKAALASGTSYAASSGKLPRWT